MMCIKLVMSKLSRSSKSYFANAKVKKDGLLRAFHSAMRFEDEGRSISNKTVTSLCVAYMECGAKYEASSHTRDFAMSLQMWSH